MKEIADIRRNRTPDHVAWLGVDRDEAMIEMARLN